MIDKQNLDKNLKEISFPRLSGTSDEVAAFKKVRQKARDLGLAPFFQKFTFSSFYARVYPKVIFSLAYCLLLILFLKPGEMFIQISLLILSICFAFLMVITRNPEKRLWGKKFHSQNLITRIPSQSNPEELEFSPYTTENIKDEKAILLFAHLDSKGQVLPIKIRILSFRLWISSFFLALIFIIPTNFLIPDFILWMFLMGIILLLVNLFATILIIINFTNNKSPGAIDNASGVVCVLELLKYYSEQKKRLNNFNLWFVFTGAEECGTMGIRNFCRKITHINKDKSYIINFDTIRNEIGYFSSSINPHVNRDLYKKLTDIIKDLPLNFYFTTTRFGVRSDGWYLKSQGYRGFGFGDLRSYKYVHSVRDTPDKVDISVLESICLFIIRALKEFDSL